MEDGVLRTGTFENSDSSQMTVKTSSEINFLFVNETAVTGQPTEYKVGHRPAIRSHVRRHTARLVKQKHKTAGRAEATGSGSTRQLLMPLGTGQDDPQDMIHDPECESCLIESIAP